MTWRATIPAMVLLFVCFASIMSLGTFVPFSSEEADRIFHKVLPHVRALAAEPRPAGSPGARRAQGYIESHLSRVGVRHETQEAFVTADWRNRHLAGHVRNIVATVEPQAPPEKTVLLVAHYDSTVNSPGANDNAVGVAALLEIMKDLAKDRPSRNRVVALFSDAEEGGLLGVRAFLQEYPGAGSVDLVINAEARGNRGPSLLFETSRTNDRLMDAVAEAVPGAVADSIFPALYRSQPNDTDLTVFLEHGIPGLNFAYIGGTHHYHGKDDDIQSLQANSVGHHVANIAGLARYFADNPIPKSEKPASYFSTLLGNTVVYAQGVAQYGIIVAAGLFVVVSLFLRKSIKPSAAGRFLWRYALFGVVAVLLGGVVSSVFVSAPPSVVFGADAHAIAYGTLAVVLGVFISRMVAIDASPWEKTAAVLAVWYALSVFLTSAAPASSHVLGGPAVLVTVGLWVAFAVEARGYPRAARIIYVAAFIPGLLSLSTLVGLLISLAGVKATGAVVAAAVLLVGLSMPVVDFAPRQSASSRVGMLWGVGGVVTLAWAGASLVFHDERPQTGVAYLYDANTGKGRWISAGGGNHVDETRIQTRLTDLFPTNEKAYFVSDASPNTSVRPAVEGRVDHDRSGSKDIVRIEAPKGTYKLTLTVRGDFWNVSLNERQMSRGEKDSPWQATVISPGETPLKLTVDRVSDRPLTAHVVFELPKGTLVPSWPGPFDSAEGMDRFVEPVVSGTELMVRRIELH